MHATEARIERFDDALVILFAQVLIHDGEAIQRTRAHRIPPDDTRSQPYFAREPRRPALRAVGNAVQEARFDERHQPSLALAKRWRFSASRSNCLALR